MMQITSNQNLIILQNMTHMPINPQIVTTREIRIAVIMITINVSSIALATHPGIEPNDSASSTVVAQAAL